MGTLPHATPLGTMCQRIVTLEPLEIAAGEDTVIPAGSKTGGQRCGFGVIESNYRNTMADGLIQGAKTINVFRACIGAQLTICAQQ